MENLNPIEEMQIVQTELILADLQTCQKYIQKLDRVQYMSQYCCRWERELVMIIKNYGN